MTRIGLTRRVAVVLAFGLASALLPSVAYAANGGENSREQISAALDRIAEGTYTDQDITLIKSFPEIARQVPDPRPSGTSSGNNAGVAVSMPVSASEQEMAPASCWWLESWQEKNDVFGDPVFRMYSRTSWCGNGSTVTSIYGRSGWFTNVASGIYFREWVNNTAYGEGHYTAHSDRQALVEWCVIKYGCYDTSYPYINQTIKANGDWSRSSSGG